MSGPVRHRYNLRSHQTRPRDSLSQRPVRHRYNLRSSAARVGSPPAVENNRVPALQTPTSNAAAMQANDVTESQTSSIPESQTLVIPTSLDVTVIQTPSVPIVQVESTASQIASGFVQHTPSSSASAMQAQGVPAMQTPLTAAALPANVEREQDVEERPLQRRRLSQGDKTRSGDAPLSGSSEVVQQTQQQPPQQPRGLPANARAARSGRPTARRGGDGRRAVGVVRRSGRGRIGEEEGQTLVWQYLGNGGFRRMTEEAAGRFREQQESRRQQRLLEEQQAQQQQQQQAAECGSKVWFNRIINNI